MMNASAARVCAVDVPSGVSDAYTAELPAVGADLTLTMGTPKRCLYLPAARSAAGEIVTVPLSFPAELLGSERILVELAQLSDLTHLIPAVPKASYKTRRGVVAVFGGALGKTGAAGLAAEGAARSGAGMTHLYVASEIYSTVAAGIRSIMVHPASERVDSDLKGANAYVAGPGWGVGREQNETLRACAASGVLGVLDADALNTLAALEPLRFAGRCVMTPHPGEFARLRAAYIGEEGDTGGAANHGGEESFLSQLRAVAAAAECVLCYKSHVLYLVAPDGRARVVDGMLPELATAGAGDVLAGIIGGFLARGFDPLNAATAGVLVHQEAASRCRDRVGWFIADDLLPEISGVLGDFTETVYE
jgi:NAD(P)H-hydrate epimerase